MAPTPPTLGGTPAKPARSSTVRRVAGPLVGPRHGPHPPNARRHAGEAGARLGRTSRAGHVSGGPDMAPTPPTLGGTPAKPARASVERRVRDTLVGPPTWPPHPQRSAARRQSRRAPRSTARRWSDFAEAGVERRRTGR